MSVLYYIAGIFILLWLMGLILKVGGTLIYWALIIGVVLFIIGSPYAAKLKRRKLKG